MGATWVQCREAWRRHGSVNDGCVMGEERDASGSRGALVEACSGVGTAAGMATSEVVEYGYALRLYMARQCG